MLGPMLARFGFVGFFFFFNVTFQKKAFGPRKKSWQVGSFFLSKSFFSKKSTQKLGVS